MKPINISAIILSVLLLVSCNDAFMERVPKTEISPETFFKTEEDLQMYIYGLYDFPGLGMCTDDYYATTDNGVSVGTPGELVNIMNNSSISSENINGGWSWGQLRKINIFMDNFRKATISQEALNHYEGVARFFRAKFYYDKVLRYNDVPWYETTLETSSEELYKKQDPRTVVVDKIMEDFAFAAQHVRTGQKGGAVDKWVVMTYYARTALFEGSWRKYHPELNLASTANKYFELAATISAEIMAKGGFSIYNTGNPKTDYRTLFISPDLTKNREVILTTIYDYDIRSNGYWAYMFGDYEPCPTKDIIQDYLMADGSYYSSQSNYKTKDYVEEFTSRDNRLYQTFVYPGWELINTETYAQGAGLHIPRLAKSFSGYHQLKGFQNTKGITYNGGIDWPVLRYAEVLLIFAEAKAELGTLTQGDLDATINVLRQRAAMPSMMLNPAIDPVQTARYPLVTNSNILEIRRERRIEFASEGYRYADLMRWNAGKLLERPQLGIYFKGLGKYDMNGDGVEDICLLDKSATIPAVKEKNSLGKDLIYYRVGKYGEAVDAFLENGTSGCMIYAPTMGTFSAPRDYYRPVPKTQVVLNPNLYQQFGWK